MILDSAKRVSRADGDKKLQIKTPSRLHFGLIDMNGSLGRVDGGVGVAIREPSYELAFSKYDGISAKGEAKKIAARICASLGVEGIRVNIIKKIPQHVGLGSKTQLSMGIAAGVCREYGIRKTSAELAALAGRGGTSGIGVGAFEAGGFIVDGGHKANKGFVPSGFSRARAPPILARYEFPWWLVCAWPGGQGAHGRREMEIFEDYSPIPAEEADRVSRIVLMKMLPALVERDISGFGEAVNLMQKTGFKKIEIGLQDSAVGELLDFLGKNSAGAGMSSFGPLCFGICKSGDEAKKLARMLDESFAFNVVATKASKGAKWL